MSYQVKCDGFPLLDVRDDTLILGNPKLDLEVNTVCGGSFTIYKNHPYYDKLKKLKSVFEVSDEIGVIFRGRMTNDSVDFYNSMAVDLEGAMAYFNDSTVRPFVFPDDFSEDADYITAAESGNVIRFFLKWLIDQHNAQVQEFQRFKLGNVTVTDPNNYLYRSNTDYANTWETLKSKLFESALGGFLCIRYEPDGNYIDYLSTFELTNTQEVVFGENMLDLKVDSDANETYSAIIPIGAELETEVEVTGDDGEATTETVKTLITLESIPDGAVTDDIYKVTLDNGLHAIYSKSAVAEYGWICAPVSDTTWDDVTEVQNLLTKSVEWLANDAVMLNETIEATAADLHFTSAQVQSFRLYRNVKVRTKQHGFIGTYPLLKLSPDLMNPQNTKISVGSTRRTLIDINGQKESQTTQRIESAEKDIEANRTQTTEMKNQLVIQSTQILNDCNAIILGALESYVETSNYSEFQQTVESQLQLLAEEMTLKFTETTKQIEDVNGDLQEKFNTITKYFTFDINGLTIGAVDNPNKVVIDNDEISILVNNVPVQKFNADGTALIPVLRITQMLDLFGLHITEDETHINCDYIGGV